MKTLLFCLTILTLNLPFKDVVFSLPSTFIEVEAPKENNITSVVYKHKSINNYTVGIASDNKVYTQKEFNTMFFSLTSDINSDSKIYNKNSFEFTEQKDGQWTRKTKFLFVKSKVYKLVIAIPFTNQTGKQLDYVIPDIMVTFKAK